MSVAALLLAVPVLAGCAGGSPTQDPVPLSLGTSPLANPDGTRPGLAPITSDADLRAASALIAKLKTAPAGPRTGYDRDQFGPAWTDNVDGVPLAHNNCDTRDDLLARDGSSVQRKAGSSCVVTGMSIYDPYTGRTVHWTKQQATSIQIDHVMPLSYDWQMGAAKWDKGKRLQIANDPLNLIPADGSQNASKGDSGPASWLPANEAVRCSYAVRFAQVALKYQLPVTAADKKSMVRLCGG
ncbi:HNH endonuclease family protein [Kitasatospora kazusensis]|uniref:HNH endonuclease family protein n=1 Tax=Kitasatospora kazusensis TaxID=407974 RepID=A0ABP5LCW5_9ACTN